MEYAKHKNILLQILKDIYSDTQISAFLGFKGGTAANMFYGLNRDSVDLDFDLLDEDKEAIVFEKITKIIGRYGKIVDSHAKRFNLILVVSYDQKSQNVKIEVNRKGSGSRFELRTILGISMLVMNREDMFANKIMAMHERIGKTSRDIYDVWFFLENRWSINKRIIEERSGSTFREVIEKCIRQLEKMDNKQILVGLGELLTEARKDWVRAKLRTETIFLLKARLASGG